MSHPAHIRSVPPRTAERGGKLLKHLIDAGKHMLERATTYGGTYVTKWDCTTRGGATDTWLYMAGDEHMGERQ